MKSGGTQSETFFEIGESQLPRGSSAGQETHYIDLYLAYSLNSILGWFHQSVDEILDIEFRLTERQSDMVIDNFHQHLYFTVLFHVVKHR